MSTLRSMIGPVLARPVPTTDARRAELRALRICREKAAIDARWDDFGYWDARIRAMTEGNHGL